MNKFRTAHEGLDSLAVAPDGQELAGCDAGSVWVWNLGTGRGRQLPFTPRYATANVDVRYSPDGRTLVCVGPVLARWRARGKKELPAWDLGPEFLTRAIAFTADSSTLAVCTAAQAKKGTAFRATVRLLDA